MFPIPATRVWSSSASPTVRPVGIATDGTSVWIVDAASGVVRKIPVGEVIP